MGDSPRDTKLPSSSGAPAEPGKDATPVRTEDCVGQCACPRAQAAVHAEPPPPPATPSNPVPAPPKVSTPAARPSSKKTPSSSRQPSADARSKSPSTAAGSKSKETAACAEKLREEKGCDGPCTCKNSKKQRTKKAAKKAGSARPGTAPGKNKKQEQKRPASAPGPPQTQPDLHADPHSHRLDPDFFLENLYCPHTLVGNWRDERARAFGYPGDSSHKKDYCFYRKPRVREDMTVPRNRTRNQAGYGHDYLTFPFVYQQYDPDRLSEYEVAINKYDCCQPKTMQPMLDFERGLVYNNGKFQDRMVYNPSRIPEDPYRDYGDLGRFSYLVPHVDVQCPPQEQRPNADYFPSPYSLQPHWGTSAGTGTSLF